MYNVNYFDLDWLTQETVPLLEWLSHFLSQNMDQSVFTEKYDCLSISDTLKIKNELAYHEQLQQQHQQKQQGLLLLLAERILLTPVELEFNGPSLPAANVVGDPNVAPTADMFENDAELVCDGFGTLSLPPISVLLLPLFSCPLS